MDFRIILGILPFLEDFDPGFDELKSFCIQSLPAVIYFKVGYVLQPLEVLYLHNVYYLKLSLIILIYYVTFTDLILEKGFMKVENVRI